MTTIALRGLALSLPLLVPPAAGAPAQVGHDPGPAPFGQRPALHLEYTLTIGDPGDERVDVALRVEGARDDALEMTMTERFAFAILPEPRLAGEVRASPVAEGAKGADPATDIDTLPIERLGPRRWRVENGGAPFDLHWSVALDHRAQPGVRGRDEYEFPYLEHDHGLLVMGALLLAPASAPARSAELRCDFPLGWEVHAPWPEREGAFQPGDSRDLLSNLVAIGAWEVDSVAVDGCEVQSLFAPRQGDLALRVAPVIAPIVKYQLDLFDHLPFTRYLFVFGRPDLRGFAGSPKRGSMTLAVGEAMTDTSAIAHLVAHEFHHTWGHSRYDLRGELRFFHEGFTDYYGWRVPCLAVTGDWSLFQRGLEQAFAGWADNPLAEEMSLVEAGGPAFFQDGRAYDLVYEGGMALAALVDLDIRRATAEGTGGGRSLDDLVRAVENDPRWSRGGAAPGVDDFEEALATFVGEERAAFWTGLARGAGVPDLTALLEELGVPFEVSVEDGTEAMRANLEGVTITALDPRGPGAAVGLREGDRVLELNGREVSTSAEVRAAWSAPEGGVVRACVTREGAEVALTAPVPVSTTFHIEPGKWRPRHNVSRTAEEARAGGR